VTIISLGALGATWREEEEDGATGHAGGNGRGGRGIVRAASPQALPAPVVEAIWKRPCQPAPPALQESLAFPQTS